MSLKVLVVEDQSSNLQLIFSFLKELDIDLYYAMNGQEALEVAIKTEPDLILLDVMLPGMDGFEVCRRIRSDKKLAEIPVIFITAKNEHDDLLTGFEAGGQDYITKPFNPLEFKARVLTQLGLRYMTKNAKSQNDALRKKIDELQHLLSEIEKDLETLHKKIEESNLS